MALTLKEARATLLSSVLHVSERDFVPLDLDRAIRGSFNRFLRETQITRTTTAVPTVSGTATLDITATSGAGEFRPGMLLDVPFISSATGTYYPVYGAAWDAIRSQLRESTARDRPEQIAWLTADTAYLYPIPDAVYTITFTWWAPLTSFNAGTGDPGAVSLNIPEQYVDDLLYWGTRAYLLKGLPGHPEADSSMAEFKEFVRQAKSDSFFSAPSYTDRGRGAETTYAPSGYI